MHGRKLTALMSTTVALVAFAPAASADEVIVCNEAENSHRGGYEVTGGPVDPLPPAFLRGSQMRIGKGAGVANAAFHSPALRLCSPEDQGGGGDGGDGGGDDGGGGGGGGDGDV